MRLLPRAEKALRRGHPWVYAESIREQNRKGTAGELAVIYDRQDRFLAVGLLDPDSPIRVRILHCGKPQVIDRDWWVGRLRDSLRLRADILEDGGTTGLRLVNGDSEGFPGLIIDRYADTLVVKLYTVAWLPRWQEMEELIREVHGPRHLVLRLSRNIQYLAKSEWNLVEGFRGEEGDEVVVFLENGLRFESAVLRGQKTGFFLDQRDNRKRVGELAAGRRVLNVFSFSGGFSLHAARGGAHSVTDLDISAHALEAARRNFGLNAEQPAIAGINHQQVQADAFEWLAQADGRYDLIVVDPPSFAKRESERQGALRAYRRLNRLAMDLLTPGGLLLAASCSAHVRADEFHEAITEEAAATGRPWRECWRSGHASDHPTSFPEAQYLKAQCLEFG